MTSFFRSAWTTQLIALAVALAGYSTIIAAPVTFRFEAEVASVSHQNGGANLPHVELADSLSGRFSFESLNPGLNHPQYFPFIFELSSQKYESNAYSITVRDQSNNWIPFEGALADPNNTPIDDRGPGGTSDTIWIGSVVGSTNDFDTPLTGSTGSIEWSASFLFAGDEGLIDGSIVPSDPSVWNSMEFQEISVVFTDAGTTNSTRVGAYITYVELVPEQSTLQSIALLAMIVSVMNRSAYRLENL